MDLKCLTPVRGENYQTFGVVQIGTEGVLVKNEPKNEEKDSPLRIISALGLDFNPFMHEVFYFLDIDFS